MKSIISNLIILLCFLSLNAFAHEMDGHDHDKASVINDTGLEPPADMNELVFEVHGMVCSFCSVGVRKKLSKLDFIDRSKFKNGVHVAIEAQRVTAAISDSSHVDIPLAYKTIKSGGYSPVKAILKDENGKLTFYDVDGSVCAASC
jgi:hypothetical protein